MFSNWPRWFAKEKSNVRTPPRARRRPSFRPEVEQLETRLAPATVATLASFDVTNQGWPMGDLVKDAHGNFFGTGEVGNAAGTVFELANNNGSYDLKTLCTLKGEYPDGGLIVDANSNLFGVTQYGGTYGHGMIFELANHNGNYAFQTLYSFTGGTDGAAPRYGLIQDANGDLFGVTTGLYGYGSGQVVYPPFEPPPPPTLLSPATAFELANHGGSYAFQTLYTFAGTTTPFSNLVENANGNFVGTASSDNTTNGQLTFFELANNNGSFVLQTLYSFPPGAGSNIQPTGVLTADANGNVFGTTWFGGTNNDGTVFELANGNGGYAFQTLYSFTGGADGNGPRGDLTVDAHGNLFGTTVQGGTANVGTVFELANGNGGYTFQTLYSSNGNNGVEPNGDLIADASGNLFGTGNSDLAGYPVFFELMPGGSNNNNSNAAANTNYVNNLYELLLHRAADAAAAYWVNLLDSGTARSTVVQDIENSTEYRNDVVGSLYYQYLKRSADSGGLAAWTGVLARGGSIEQVIQGLVGSPEYFALHGSSPSGFVSALYQDVLNRTASTGEMQSWVNALNSGASRSHVALGFLTSTEYRTNLVDSYYAQFLGRSADLAGQAAWVQALQAGMGDQALRAAFLGSAEAAAKWS